jgi:hypothetical protein
MSRLSFYSVGATHSYEYVIERWADAGGRLLVRQEFDRTDPDGLRQFVEQVEPYVLVALLYVGDRGSAESNVLAKSLLGQFRLAAGLPKAERERLLRVGVCLEKPQPGAPRRISGRSAFRRRLLPDPHLRDSHTGARPGATSASLARMMEAAMVARPIPRGSRLQSAPSVKPTTRLSADLQETGRGGHRLVITNTGSLDVHDVDVTVPPEVQMFRLHADSLPVAVLRPGERVRQLASVSMGGGPSVFDIELTGRTPDGEAVTFPPRSASRGRGHGN